MVNNLVAGASEIRVNQVALQPAFGKQAVLVSIAGTYFKQRRDARLERLL